MFWKRCYQKNAFYTVLGIDQQGKKDVLGLYLSESEGSNFWLSVLTDLNNRGVKDIFIACIDGLKGFTHKYLFFKGMSCKQSLSRSNQLNIP